MNEGNEMKILITNLVFIVVTFGSIESSAQSSEKYNEGLLAGFKIASESKVYKPEIAVKYCKIYANQRYSEGSAFYDQFLRGCQQGYQDGFGQE